MGARSSGGSGMGHGRDFGRNVRFDNPESLKAIQDKGLYKEMKQGISRFYKELGIPERNIGLADLNGAYGVTLTGADGKTIGVYLNKSLYKTGTKKTIGEAKKKDYASGWATKTNNPVQHTLTHELAHTVWNSHMKGANHKAAGKAISSLYKKWKADKKKKGYGQYAKTNVNEFWAETITKGIHGNADKYTKKAMGIAKKYKL